MKQQRVACVGDWVRRSTPTHTRSHTLNDVWRPGKIHHLIIIFAVGIR